MKYVIGVDLGLKGGIALIDENKKLLSCLPLPTFEVMVGKKKRNIYDIKKIHNTIKTWQIELKHATFNAGMERLRAFPGQAAQVGFSLGGSDMLFRTLFTVFGIPFIVFEPQMWQKHIFIPLGIQYTKQTTKQASIQAAKQLFPEQSFIPMGCRVPSDGLSDSACIAIYTKYVNENL